MDFKVAGQEASQSSTRAVQNEDFRGLRRARLRRARASGFWIGCFWPSRWTPIIQSRREHGTIVTLACIAAGGDLLLHDVSASTRQSPAATRPPGWTEQTLYLRANTEKGEALIAKVAEPCLEAAEMEEIAARRSRRRQIMEKLPLADLYLDGFDREMLLENFQFRPSGRSSAEACLGCGTCTFVCPTCQCYDIRDFDTGHGHSALPLLGFLHVFRLYADGPRQSDA